MRNFRTLVCKFRTLKLGVRKWHPFNWGFRTLKWGVRNFRTLKSGVRNFRTLKSSVRNFRTLFHTVRKVAWGVRKWHSCARRGFRTVRKFSHLAQWCAKLVFREFAPWNHFSHLGFGVCEIFAPWNQVCEIFAPWNQVLCFLGFAPLSCFWRVLYIFHDFFLQFIIKIDLN